MHKIGFYFALAASILIGADSAAEEASLTLYDTKGGPNIVAPDMVHLRPEGDRVAPLKMGIVWTFTLKQKLKTVPNGGQRFPQILAEAIRHYGHRVTRCMRR